MLGIFIYIAACILLGGISCFFGKKLFFPVLTLTILICVISYSFSIFEVSWKVFIVAALIGIIAALLAKALYRLGIFLIGAALGGGLGITLASFLPASMEQYDWVLTLVLAILFGICAEKWCSLFIMIATAYNGAAIIAAPVCFLFMEFSKLSSYVSSDGILSTMTNLNQYISGEFTSQSASYILIGTIIIALIGFVYQYSSSHKRS